MVSLFDAGYQDVGLDAGYEMIGQGYNGACHNKAGHMLINLERCVVSTSQQRFASVALSWRTQGRHSPLHPIYPLSAPCINI